MGRIQDSAGVMALTHTMMTINQPMVGDGGIGNLAPDDLDLMPLLTIDLDVEPMTMCLSSFARWQGRQPMITRHIMATLDDNHVTHAGVPGRQTMAMVGMERRGGYTPPSISRPGGLRWGTG